ncbi:MAG TPA: cellulase family glycosylhydrolase, partial [Chloroflexota bacterium]|nr:cellulase family glycosylhydrolase [Chloroflexota bacterium]
ATATATATVDTTATATATVDTTATAQPTSSLTPAATTTVLPTTTVTPTATGCAAPYLHTSGSHIVNACGTPVRLQAVNWYGFDSNDFVAAGLHYWSYKTIVHRIKTLGFNALRIPFSNEMVERDPVVSTLGSICHQDSCVPVPGTTTTPLTGSFLLAAISDTVRSNSDLYGLDALHVLKQIVDYAGRQGLYVILDDHRSEAAWGPQEEGLWYTSTDCTGAAPYTCYAPQSWLNDWHTVGSLLATDPYVTGMDVRNEPHWVNPTVPGGPARWRPSSCAAYVHYAHWGSCGGVQDNPSTDWPQAAAQAGDELLGINANWLIIVEGGSTYPQSDGTFSQDGWGENLQGVAADPITLTVPGRLVYSPHDYANYDKDDTVADMYNAWTRNFGFLAVPGSTYSAPLWVGEFGTCADRNTCIMDGTPGPPYGNGDKYGWWFNTFRFYEDNQCLMDTTTNSQVCPAGSSPSYMGGPLSWAYWPVNGTFSDAWSYAQARWQTCYGNREGFGVVGGDWVAPSTPLLLQSLFGGPSSNPAATLAVATPPSSPWPTGACVSYSNAPVPTPTASATPTPTASATNTPTATSTNTPTASATPIPTATDTPTPRPTPCLPLLLAIRLSQRSVVTGGTLTVGIHTAAHARNTVMVQVVTRKTIVTGAGRHRRQVTRSIVAYRAALRGTADRHGRFTARLRIAYRLARLAPARLTVTALKGCSSAAHTLALTIRPRSQQPLVTRVTPRYLAATHTLLVGIDTLPRARVTVTLSLVRQKIIVTGRGRSRRRVVRTVVLYLSTVTGTANAHGHLTGTLRIPYRPPRAAQARVQVTVSTPRGTSTRTSPVTL